MKHTTDTRLRIITAAQELIYTRSYNQVGVQEICDRAGVKKGSFYHFFHSKRDLALAVLDQSQALMHETIISKAFVADIPPLARIERFFSAIQKFQQQVKGDTGFVLGCPFGNLGCEMSTQDEAIRNRVDDILRAAERPFEMALAEAVVNGELPAIDTAATARAIFAYVEGIMIYAKTRNDSGLIRELGKYALKLAIPANMQ
jgi:TetR/AcrR family transcriptional repressor of nem operon